MKLVAFCPCSNLNSSLIWQHHYWSWNHFLTCFFTASWWLITVLYQPLHLSFLSSLISTKILHRFLLVHKFTSLHSLLLHLISSLFLTPQSSNLQDTPVPSYYQSLPLWFITKFDFNARSLCQDLYKKAFSREARSHPMPWGAEIQYQFPTAPALISNHSITTSPFAIFACLVLLNETDSMSFVQKLALLSPKDIRPASGSLWQEAAAPGRWQGHPPWWSSLFPSPTAQGVWISLKLPCTFYRIENRMICP